MELGGAWRAIEADEALRRRYPEPDFDDAGWGALAVPGHWRSSPDFATSDGPLLTRRRFDAPTPAAGRRSWLSFEGLFYQSDVWLDGSYLGDTEGYFFPHTFEVTDQLAGRSEHVLAAEVTCSPQNDRRAKRNLTGVFQHWDCFPASSNPGGIWRPVRLSETGPVRIAHLRVVCAEAGPERAVLSFRAVLDSSVATTIDLRTLVADRDHVEEHALATGLNRVEWRVAVENPPLWWPAALGEARLVDLSVEARVREGAGHFGDGWDGGGDASTDGAGAVSELSDRRILRSGIRQVRMKNWIASVNGERLFLKGSNLGPTHMALGEATAGDLEGDIVAARAAGLDLVRVHGHVSRPELYDAADRHGMLVWQDLPLQWGYARGTRKQAVLQAREAVDLLSHHPSIALWCAHNEPFGLDVGPGATGDLRRPAGKVVRGMLLPSWNKTVLDRSLRRALVKADRSRPVLAHSGIPPSTDSHLYFGWYHGAPSDLARLAAAWPRLAGFVGEFGAQAVPDSDAFLEPERWPDLDWERLGREHALQKVFFERNGLDPADHPTFDGWRDATQAYQADLVRRQVETLRRLKYRPAGGFAQFCLADGHPGVTWSVLDAERRPKPAYAALAAACAPLIVVADLPKAAYAPGASMVLDLHVVNDGRTELSPAEVTADVRWAGGGRRRRWTGSVPADDCVRVATLQVVVPDAPGALTLDLSLAAGDVVVTNRYETRITDCAPTMPR